MVSPTLMRPNTGVNKDYTPSHQQLLDYAKRLLNEKQCVEHELKVERAARAERECRALMKVVPLPPVPYKSPVRHTVRTGFMADPKHSVRR